MAAEKRLTGKEALFVAYYTQHWNGSRAVREAGYRSKVPGAYAYELLKKPDILAAVEIKREQADKLNQDLIRQSTDFYRRQLLADPKALFDASGQPKLPHELDDDSATLLLGVETETIVADGKSKVVAMKVKIADRRAAADSVQKYVNDWERKSQRFPGGRIIEGEVVPEVQEETDVVVHARRVAFALRMGVEVDRKKLLK